MLAMMVPKKGADPEWIPKRVAEVEYFVRAYKNQALPSHHVWLDVATPVLAIELLEVVALDTA